MKRQSAIRCIFSVIGLFATSLLAIANAQEFDDFRIWNEFMFTQFKGSKWRTYTWGELRRTDSASRLGTWFIQQKVYFKATPSLELGGGASWIETEDRTADSWNTLARLELEANPSWKLGAKAKLSLRNRLEVRWHESRDWKTGYVTRHRVLYSKSASWFESMTRYEASNELFYDHSTGAFIENRFRPLNLFFKGKAKSTVNLFVQVRSQRPRGEGDWAHAFILDAGLRR